LASLRSADAMRTKLRLFRVKFPKVVAAALYAETQIEVTECKKLCPVYVGPTGPGKPIPGLLRDSIHSEGPFYEGLKIWMRIVAGGAAGAYAIPQHENLEFHHEVGQAKFIEQPLMQSRPFIAARVANRIQFSKLGI
jgi:hypothetical protein